MRIFVAGALGWRKEGDELRPDVNGRADAALEVGARLLAAGFDPFVPHLSIAWLRRSVWWDGRPPDERWRAWAVAWLCQCQAVVLVSPGAESEGTAEEVALARSIGLPVFLSVEDCLRSFPKP